MNAGPTINVAGFCSYPCVLVVLFRSVVKILPPTREELGLVQRQYSPQFRERVVPLI